MTSLVVVVGAINVDLVVVAPRLPGPGETVVGGALRRHGGGKGANAAVAAARAGAAVRLIGAVGADADGTAALAGLEAEGVDVSEVVLLPDEATGVALIVVSAEGENQIAVGVGANAAVTSEHVRRALAEVLPRAGCVLVSTEIPARAVAAAVECATSAGVLCILNPAPVTRDLLELLRHGPVLTPNASESLDLLRLLDEGRGASSDGDAPGPGAAAQRLVERTGAPVVVTLGAEGALVLAEDGSQECVPPRPADVRDTTGAGDTFNGVLATRLADGDPLAQAVLHATTAASLSVAEVGARDGMPTEPAIRAALSLR